ncbi:MAG TPA: glucosamine-6-phosphate deaminase [Candidatus Nitrosotalea sp.]|nr:glucosamine-6-phosphate deaminase [Candidatus Nitrosotalea sp.]
MNVLRFDSETAWVDCVASLWRDRLRAKPNLRTCLASGHTPNRIYEAMGASVVARRISFRKSEIFALDEYGGLAAEDEGKCVNMLRRRLLDHIDLPADRFHFIDVDAPDLKKVCRDYDALIGNGFDLVLLGIGLNGHLGLNEPGSSPDSTTRRVEMHPISINASATYVKQSALPGWGVTVGLKHLLASREAWLLANGPRKAAIIQRLLHSNPDDQLPASLLRRHSNSYLFVDAEAGSLL